MSDFPGRFRIPCRKKRRKSDDSEVVGEARATKPMTLSLASCSDVGVAVLANGYLELRHGGRSPQDFRQAVANQVRSSIFTKPSQSKSALVQRMVPPQPL